MSVGKIKSALVVEGGGMRGAFSAGVLHAFGKAGFYPYDMYIGVSAGACILPRIWRDRTTETSTS
jgi:predicted patatin/cPLA2 family phospholipase